MDKKKQEDLSSYDAIKKAFIKRCEDLSHVHSLHDVIRDFAELGRITIVTQGNTLSMKMGRSFPTPALCTQQWSERL